MKSTSYRSRLSKVEAMVDMVVHSHNNYARTAVYDDFETGTSYWVLYQIELKRLTIHEITTFQSDAFHERLNFVMNNIHKNLPGWYYQSVIDDDMLFVVGSPRKS